MSQLGDKSSEELASIYTPTKKRKDKVVRKKDHERFRIYWFRNRQHHVLSSYGLWALFFSCFAAAGWLTLSFREVARIMLSEEAVGAIRRDSWEFLNSNIGAYSFAGTIIALLGFSALQWWQSLDAKKQLMLRSGIISSERAEVARRGYDRVRRAILSTRFALPLRYTYWPFISEQVEIPGFDALQTRLLDLAAPRFENATARRRREISSFANIRDPQAFAGLLKLENEITQEQFEKVVRLLDHARADRLLEAAEITQQLVEEVNIFADATAANT